MRHFKVMTECLNCQDNKLWHFDMEASDLQDAENQAVKLIDKEVFADDYPLCCPSSPLMIIAIKEVSEGMPYWMRFNEVKS